jgi:dethiobiotin synthetase
VSTSTTGAPSSIEVSPRSPGSRTSSWKLQAVRSLLFRAYERLRADASFVVVEGVGGFRVPLSASLDTADMARAFALPVVLVVGLRLGCLNHALLTADAIRGAGLALAGWIANAIDPEMAVREENVAALRERLAAPLLGELPHSPRPVAPALARHLDVTPLLEGGA